MRKIEEYRQKLRTVKDWESFLKSDSHLPGPRSNLELAFAVSLEGSEDQFLHYASFDVKEAPENTSNVFIVDCGVMGMGYLTARAR